MIRKELPTIALTIAVAAVLASCRHTPHRQGPSAPETNETDQPSEPAQSPAPGEEMTAEAPGPRPTTARPEVEEAIRRGLVPLQADGDAWMEGSAQFQDGDGCVSCHQVPYGLWGLHEAARAGIVIDEGATADLTRRAVAFVDNTRTGRPMSWSPLMLAQGTKAAGELSTYVDHLLGAQRPAGFWEAKGQFPTQRRELSETNAVATMFTILALADAASEDETVAASLDRAETWVVERGAGKSTEWLALRALVAQVRTDGEAALASLALLLEQQNADGGWGWNPGEESNAMSTGEALYALGLTTPGTPPGVAEAARRGQAYLVATQGDDGWWRVASDLVSTGRDESKDYVYDYWGTAWATIGLARWHQAS